MKISAPVAVIAAAALIVTGMVTADAAVTTTTTHPVKLCSGAFNIVSTPIRGACPRHTTTFYVAANADVQALAARVDALEALVAAQPKRPTIVLSAGPVTDGKFVLYATTTNAPTGSNVAFSGTAPGGVGTSIIGVPTDADGVAHTTELARCEYLPDYGRLSVPNPYTGTDYLVVTSEPLTAVPGC
jgi:hypothetical protein